MRDKRGVPTIAWVGFGLLLFAAVLLSLGRRDLQAKPNADSFGPSGVSAFRTLLEKNGYTTRIDLSSRPRFFKDDTVIAFLRKEPKGFFDFGGDTGTNGDDTYDDPVQDSLHTFLDRGGKALFLPIDQDFPAASRAVLDRSPSTVSSSYAPGKYQITPAATVTTAFLDELSEDHDTARALWEITDQQDEVYGLSVGKGLAMVGWNGLGVTNRFVDQAENAAFFLRLVKSLSGDSKRIVFVESTFDDPQKMTLVEAIGPWANASWQQVLLLGVVIVYTLGKRLGLPEQERRRERSSRELVNAVADTMDRAKAANMAMKIALDRADVRLRNHLKLSRDADRRMRDERLPMTLQSALATLEAASLDRYAPPEDALRRIQRLNKEMDEFLGPAKRSTRT